MLRVGLTGGLGSGKSTVAKMFADLGIKIIDADLIAHQLTALNTPAYYAIQQHFGDQVILANNHLDRKQLRQIIFKQPEERVWLENYLHPLIIQEIHSQLELISAPYCIIVIPLLTEIKLAQQLVDRVCVIDIPEKLQKKRIALRDHIDPELIAAMLAIQSSHQQRLKIADDIIYNDGDFYHLRQQVQALHSRYLAITHAIPKGEKR